MANGEFEFGVSKHTWNDWDWLASILEDHYVNIPQTGRGSWGKNDEDLKQRLKEQIGGYVDPHFGKVEAKGYVVRPYLERLHLSPSELTQERIAEINRRYEQRGFGSGLTVEAVKRDDELARLCNESVMASIREGKPIEWGKLLDWASEAGRLIYGSEKGTFLDKIFVGID